MKKLRNLSWLQTKAWCQSHPLVQISRERHLAPAKFLFAATDRAISQYEISHTTGHLRGNHHFLARSNGVKNLDISNGGQSKVFQRANRFIGLRGDSCNLRHRFNHQDTGENWLAGEMAAQKFFAAFQREFRRRRDTGIQRQDCIDKTKLRAVGKHRIKGYLPSFLENPSMGTTLSLRQLSATMSVSTT